MSAYEDAIYAMRLPTVTVRMSGQLSDESARELAAAFLAALGDVVVVDGKVMEWEKVEQAVCDLVLDNDPATVVWHQVERLAGAARKVAE